MRCSRALVSPGMTRCLKQVSTTKVTRVVGVVLGVASSIIAMTSPYYANYARPTKNTKDTVDYVL